MKIRLNPCNGKSIDKAIEKLEQYKNRIARKETEMLNRLSMLGASVASLGFRRAIYSGKNDVNIRVEIVGNVATIYAEGEAVGFIEFGTGARYGHGHPQNGEFGVGPGTWSTSADGKGHWDDPKGWWYGSGQHTYGNPPAMAMYGAVQTVAEQIATIAREVWSSD